jgi:hypothetical protein
VHFAEEQPSPIAHPVIPYSAVLTVERRISHEGMISIGGNFYSVPDAIRKRVVEVQNHPKEVRIFEDGRLIASHPLLEGRNQRRTDRTLCRRAHPGVAFTRTATVSALSARRSRKLSLSTR